MSEAISVQREPRPCETTLKYLGRLDQECADGWARRLRTTVEAERASGGHRSPEAILIGKGMEDPDMRAQVLERYEELPE